MMMMVWANCMRLDCAWRRSRVVTAISGRECVGKLDHLESGAELEAHILQQIHRELSGLLYLHSGTAGMEEGIHQNAETIGKMLQDGGAKHVVVQEAKGFAHEWQTWRHALHDFAPRIFHD